MLPKKKPPAPPVASTGCSSLRSWSCLPRRAAPQPRVSDGGDAVGAPAAEHYLKRMQFLEEERRLLDEEIRRLSKCLGREERAAPAVERVARGGPEEGGESVKNVTVAKAGVDAGVAATQRAVRNDSAKSKEEGRITTGTDTASSASTKSCVSVGPGGAGGVQGVIAKLEDGSYLRQVISRVGRKWERLAVQVSRPVVPGNAVSASVVLDRMTAMSANDLCKLLTQIMPLKDIAGRQAPAGEPMRRTARLSTGDDLLEALVFEAMDRMEGLVQEGLKIQRAATDFTFTAAPADHRRRNDPVSKNGMVHVVLMQVRDPKKWYAAIGVPMIGIIEASLETEDGKVRLEMQGMHVAGISFVNGKSSGDTRCMMWSASLQQCKGPRHGGDDGCRCNCIRNPNRVFRQ